MLQFHNESKPSIFDYVLRISINNKANADSDNQESPYVTEIIYPVSDQEIKLPKTFQGIGLFFFVDAKDKYLTKGHPRYELQWKEYSSFSFCLTDEKKNIYFVFAYSHSTSVYCVISDYYHPAFLSDFIYVLSISKNPSEFAQKINDIFINSANHLLLNEDETIFLKDQNDWYIKNFQYDNSDSGSGSAYSMPLQGPKSSSSSTVKNSKISLMSTRKASNLSTAKITTPTKHSESINSLYGITHTNHMSPENEIFELYKFIFSDLPVEYILMLIDALLLDFKIIIISKDVEKLGKAAFAIIGLLYPLKWPGSFIPVCPEVMSTFLEAPFPYIIGIHSSLSMKLLEGDNMVYCVYNVDAHYVANIGMEDFPPSVLNYIDLVAEKIKTLIHTYSPLFPFAHIQREIRKFIKGTLANSYGLDPDDFGYKELMADFVVWRDESSSEYAAYFSQSQTVDHFMHSLENSEYEKDDRVFKAFFPDETFMGTVHIPRQLVEESIEKEKEDGIKINIADLQLRSKSYPKTAVKVNNDRLVNFESSKKAKDDNPPKVIQTPVSNSSTNASDSESSHKSSKRTHKHKHHHQPKTRTSLPINDDTYLDEKLKVEAVSQYPMGKRLKNSTSSSSDSEPSIDDNLNVEQIIKDRKNSKQAKKKYRNSSHIKGHVSTFSTDSASISDASSSVSDSDQSLKSKPKRRVPPDLPAIPSKKTSNETSRTESESKSTPKKKKSNKKKKDTEKKKKATKKSKSSSKSETNSESESGSEKKNKNSPPKKEEKTILIIESDSDVASSSNDDNFDDDSGNWSSSSSPPPPPEDSKKKATENKSKSADKKSSNEEDSDNLSSDSKKKTTENKSKSVNKKSSNEEDLDNLSSSEEDSSKKGKNQKQTKKESKKRLKKKKPYKFDSDSESKSDKNENSNDYESDSNQIHQKEKESIIKMAKRKSNLSSDSTNDDDSNKEEESHDFIDSPIPKKKSKFVQEDDLVSSKNKSKNKNKSSQNESESNDESEDSDDLKDSTLKTKNKKSSNLNQNQKKTKKRKNRYDSDSNNSKKSDDSD